MLRCCTKPNFTYDSFGAEKLFCPLEYDYRWNASHVNTHKDFSQPIYKNMKAFFFDNSTQRKNHDDFIISHEKCTFFLTKSLFSSKITYIFQFFSFC